MAPRFLLGPPELYAAPSALEPADIDRSSSDPFIDVMVEELVADFNRLSAGHHQNRPSSRGFTENGSATYLSSGDPCLDFFFHVVPDTPPELLVERLAVAWAHGPHHP